MDDGATRSGNKSCCIVGCTNRYQNTSKDVKFYKFPTKPWEKDKGEKWIQAVNRKRPDGTRWEPTASSCICSQHFIGNSKSQHPLNPSYLPTIFPDVYKVPQLTESQKGRFHRLNKRIKPSSDCHKRAREHSEDLPEAEIGNDNFEMPKYKDDPDFSPWPANAAMCSVKEEPMDAVPWQGVDEGFCVKEETPAPAPPFDVYQAPEVPRIKEECADFSSCPPAEPEACWIKEERVDDEEPEGFQPGEESVRWSSSSSGQATGADPSADVDPLLDATELEPDSAARLKEERPSSELGVLSKDVKRRDDAAAEGSVQGPEAANCGHARQNTRRNRRWGVRPIYQTRDSLGEYFNSFQEMKNGDQEMFFQYTRMTSATYDALLGLVTDRLTKKCRTTRVIAPGQRLALTLRYLSTGDSMQSLALSYRVGKTTVHKIIKETCQAIWDVLHPLYLRPPNQAEWLRYAEGFSSTWDLPNCCGAMDGKHIAMQTSKTARSSQQTHNVVVFAVCDHSCVFRSVDIGCHGSEGGVAALSNHQFSRALERNALDLPPPRTLPQSQIPFPHYFVGDETFPLRDNLIRPYAGKNSNDERRVFNYRLSRARRTIENSFGVLASRWGIFRRPIAAEPDTVEGVVRACVCLHNYLKLSDRDAAIYCPERFVDGEGPDHELAPGGWRREIAEDCAVQRIGRLGANNFRVDAANGRDVLARYLCSQGGALPWQDEVTNRGPAPM